jgi:hypothetical protein
MVVMKRAFMLFFICSKEPKEEDDAKLFENCIKNEILIKRKSPKSLEVFGRRFNFLLCFNNWI